ncbi:hypothetical protein I553_6830 [Mycobacterium xenopi 4042]|uniref:Uncharacterized protein n=1 Tax=Mycobacterium xenopi 4042 TaxID=1299334 RepID=X7Z3U8_MYCXE|nr:hypothetical protein I553_6830 [Mycobacterium xenopi 4042]
MTVTPFPWLSVLWLVPLVGAGLVIVMPPGWRQAAKWLGLIIAVAVLGIALVITTEFDTGGARTSSSKNNPGYRPSARATPSASTASRWCWCCSLRCWCRC